MTCPNCGHELTSTNHGLACLNCGYTGPTQPANAVAQAAPQQPAAPTPSLATPPTPVPPPIVPPAPVQAAPSPPSPAVPPTPGRRPLMARLKKLLIPGIALLVLLTAAGIVYFKILPDNYAKAYAATMKDPAAHLHTTIDKAIGSFGRPAFAKSDTTTKNDKADVAYAQDSINSAKKAYATYGTAATSLRILPLTGWSKSVKDAVDNRKDYLDYGTSVKKFLSDYQQLVTYASKVNAIGATIEAKFNELDKLSSADPGGTLTKMADEMDSVGTDFRAITPPTYLQNYHNELLAEVDNLAIYLRAIAKAYKDHSLTEFNAASKKLYDLSNEGDATDKKFIDSIQNNSVIKHDIDDLKGSSIITI